MDVPPKLTPAKSLRVAMASNFALPGAGQWYLGQRRLGSVLMAMYLAGLFLGIKCVLGGISTYFRIASSERLLDPGVLEQLAVDFQLPWLLTAFVLWLTAHLLSLGLLYFARRRGPAPH